MSLVNEDMINENKKSMLYADFFKAFQTSETNLNSEFLDSIRCSGIYIPKPWEVISDYRKKASEEGLSQEWIDKFIPESLANKELY
ncbi:MAG: hypothetical protein K6B41_08935 [Butyrivibrio sp.]|nr:hypothetical protein [Butyrivibrio sp.]